MNKAGERLLNGLVKENPTFVLMLGMCPTLAVTTSAMNGLGMGLTTTAVLTLSNLFISLLRKVIPNRVRIPAFIVIIASFVTMVQLLLQAYLPSLNRSLGVYIPLIVVNCIILGRAESYAYHNPVIPSVFDGLGMGLGFSFALTCIGAVRELLGAGKVFDMAILPDSFEPIRIFGQAPGAFFVLAALVALQNAVKNRRKRAGKPYEKIGSGCSHDCMNCGEKGCSSRFYDTDSESSIVKPSSAKPSSAKPSYSKFSSEPKKTAGQEDERKAKQSEESSETDTAVQTAAKSAVKKEPSGDTRAEGKADADSGGAFDPLDGMEIINLDEEE